MEINKTVIVASHLFLYYLIYIDDARSDTNQVHVGCHTNGGLYPPEPKSVTLNTETAIVSEMSKKNRYS